MNGTDTQDLLAILDSMQSELADEPTSSATPQPATVAKVAVADGTPAPVEPVVALATPASAPTLLPLPSGEQPHTEPVAVEAPEPPPAATAATPTKLFPDLRIEARKHADPPPPFTPIEACQLTTAQYLANADW